ncbi:MAG TPA: hypothetical protein VIV60_19460 [Polyangiaceae bacterium]
MNIRMAMVVSILGLVGCGGASDYEVTEPVASGGAAPQTAARGGTSATSSTTRNASVTGGATLSPSGTGGTGNSALGNPAFISGSAGITFVTGGTRFDLGSAARPSTGGVAGASLVAATQPAGVGWSDSDTGVVFLGSGDDSPCMLDEHCPSGYVCSKLGVDPELAQAGVGHCIASAKPATGTGGAYSLR